MSIAWREAPEPEDCEIKEVPATKLRKKLREKTAYHDNVNRGSSGVFKQKIINNEPITMPVVKFDKNGNVRETKRCSVIEACVEMGEPLKYCEVVDKSSIERYAENLRDR